MGKRICTRHPVTYSPPPGTVKGRKILFSNHDLQPSATKNPTASCMLRSVFLQVAWLQTLETSQIGLLRYFSIFSSSSVLSDQCQEKDQSNTSQWGAAFSYLRNMPNHLAMLPKSEARALLQGHVCGWWHRFPNIPFRPGWFSSVITGLRADADLKVCNSCRVIKWLSYQLRSRSPEKTAFLPAHHFFLLCLQKNSLPKWRLEEQLQLLSSKVWWTQVWVLPPHHFLQWHLGIWCLALMWSCCQVIPDCEGVVSVFRAIPKVLQLRKQLMVCLPNLCPVHGHLHLEGGLPFSSQGRLMCWPILTLLGLWPLRGGPSL